MLVPTRASSILSSPAAAVLAAMLLAGCSSKAPPPADPAVPVSAVEAVAKTVPELIGAVGTVEAINSVALKSLVDGQLQLAGADRPHVAGRDAEAALEKTGQQWEAGGHFATISAPSASSRPTGAGTTRPRTTTAWKGTSARLTPSRSAARETAKAAG